MSIAIDLSGQAAVVTGAGSGIGAVPAAFDIADPEATAKGMAAARAEVGPVRIVVNNAASSAVKLFADTTLEEIDCLGIHIARIEVKAVLEKALDRIRDWEITGDVTYSTGQGVGQDPGSGPLPTGHQARRGAAPAHRLSRRNANSRRSAPPPLGQGLLPRPTGGPASARSSPRGSSA